MLILNERRSKIVRNRVEDCQSKTLFLAIFDPHSSIVRSVLLPPIRCGDVKPLLKPNQNLTFGIGISILNP